MGIYRFGLFELDVERRELSRGGRRLPLQDQPLAVLGLLLERPGETVSRETLRDTLWPPEVHVEYGNSLNAAVSRLRDVLDDSAANPRFIATVPRQGYRFIAPVEMVGGDGESAIATSRTPGDIAASKIVASEAPGRRVRRRVVVAVGVLLGLLIAWWVAPWTATERSAEPFDGIAAVQDSGRAFPAGEEQRLRLAVLPMATLSSEPDQEFLGDGLTEELIGRLGALDPKKLAVIARTSVMPYKGSEVGVQQIGADLGVDYLLEGSLRRQDDTARISVRLIRVADESQLWQRSFERPMVGLLQLQKEISDDVARSLALRLLADAPGGQERSETTVPRAYELFLKGQYLLNQTTHEGFRQALASFHEAIELDPEFLAAHLGVAEAWILLGIFDAVLPAKAEEQASQAIDRILEIDPDDSGGLLGRAYLRFHYRWQWQGAEDDFIQVLEAAPNLTQAHVGYATFLRSQGRFDEGMEHLEQALELDPLSLRLRADQCWHLFAARRFDAAAERCRQALELDAEYTHAQDNLKWVLMRAGRETEAIDAFLRLVELEGDRPETTERYRRIGEVRGLRGMVETALAARQARADVNPQAVVPYDMAIDAVAVGQLGLALDWLEKSYARRETDLVFLAVDPRLDALRSDPRFLDLSRRVGVPTVELSTVELPPNGGY